MHIVHLHQYFSTPDMAGITRTYEVAKRLVKAGHTVDMVTSDRVSNDGGGGWRVTEVDGIRVHWVSVPYSQYMGYARRIRAFFEFSVKAAFKAASLGGDVVFATTSPLTIALPAAYASRRNKIPMVMEICDVWPAVPIALGAIRDPISIAAARWLERFAYRSCARIIALAPGMKDAIVETGYPADRVSVISNGCDLDIFGLPAEAGLALRRSRAWLGDRPMVCYIGAIGKVNGLSYLVRLAAAARELDPEVRFVVVGEGKERPLVTELARGLGVLDVNFFMLGPLPKREAAVWLNASDLSVALFTGPRVVWKDAVQNKFFDALAAGKPVVNNFDGWQSQIALEAGAGIIIDPDDVDTAARDVVTIVRDREWLAKAGAAAKALAMGRFSRDRLVAQVEGVLREAAADGRAA